jgi:tripartite-type tricarboxylate transporter receptor subunit TctC
MMSKYLGLAAILLSVGTQCAVAQDYPSRPIRLVVPSSPGGGTDISARILANKLGGLVGQQIIVENRPGAGSMIGNEYVARSAPDGYTLLMGISTLSIIPSVYKRPSYNVLTDLAPVSQAVSLPNILVVHPSVPAKTVGQLIAIAQRSPGKLVCGSAGTGSNPHLSAELFKSFAKVNWVHVPFKGSGPGLVSLRSGEIDLMFPSITSAISHVRAGKMRALGVTTTYRAKALPDVPTMAQAGLKGFKSDQWFGVLAPTGTPRPIVEYLNKKIVSALRSPDVTKRFSENGAEIVASSPEQFSAYIKSQLEMWKKVARGANIKPR